MNYQRFENRTPLANRQWPMRDDVSDAIQILVHQDAHGLPIALKRDAVAEQLVLMHHTEEDGTRRGNKFDVERTRRDFVNYLKTSGWVFQSGYKLCEYEKKWPIVPATSYFFKVVYADGSARDCLDAMLPDDLKESIPKRTKRYGIDGNGQAVPLDELPHTDDGNTKVLDSGSIEGIVVFPEGSKARLIAEYHNRIMPSAQGAITRMVDKLENTSLNKPAIADMRDAVDNLASPVKRIGSTLERVRLIDPRLPDLKKVTLKPRRGYHR